VYLFNEIRVGGGSDPLQQWHILVLHHGNQVRKISLRELASLNTDQAGYRLLKMHP
jgi:protein involved in polysaccharide export with SLBB domain